MLPKVASWYLKVKSPNLLESLTGAVCSLRRYKIFFGSLFVCSFQGLSLTIQPFVVCILAVVKPVLTKTVSISGAASPVAAVAVADDVDEFVALDGAVVPWVESVAWAAACSHSLI